MRWAATVAEDLVQRLTAAEQGRQQGVASELFDREVASAVDTAMAQLSQSDLWGPANRMASNEFWRIAEPWLRHGELQVRARTKPRGYAGDFELLRRICHQSSCDHPLGGALDRYFLNQAAPQAVRHRTELVAQRVVDRCRDGSSEPLRIVSIGSGPAMELQLAAERLSGVERQRLRITLLDLDQQALDYASSRLTPLLGPNDLEAVRGNLSRLPRNSKLAAAISPADYVFCAGFFDYLDEDAAVEMLNLFLSTLSVDGELTVFNFSPANSSRAYMEWIGNWYLTYRDTAAMQRLAKRLGAIGHVHVRSVSQGTLVELTTRPGTRPCDLPKTDGEPSGPV